MNSEWVEVIEIIGYEAAEKLRSIYGGNILRVPKMVPRAIVVPLIKEELKRANYKDLRKKYGLSERTIRRYEKWKLNGSTLISPSGREYDVYKKE